MSFFVLVDGSLAEDALQRFRTTVAQAGFSGQRDIRLANTRLLIFGDQTGEAPLFFESDNGDFVSTLGSLLYHGIASPACLPRLLADFDAESFDWGGLVGTHVILVHKDNRLHLVGDGLGACKIYSNSDGTLCSNSFFAMCELAGARHVDIQACYEYVCNGAVFGTRTLLEGVKSLPANAILARGDDTRVIRRPSPITDRHWDPATALDHIADHLCAQLDRVFEPIVGNYGDRLRVSFSGGFDSRLMLAMALRHGARPALFVYGGDDDEDVRIARVISNAEGLELIQIDKALGDPSEPDAFSEVVQRDLIAFDGWKVEHGLFDFGIDGDDRRTRHVGGQIPLNGSLGEIYRNFFYMPDRDASTGAVVSTFYSQYDPKAFTGRFDEQRYRAAMQAAMREAVRAADDRLARPQVEALYPRFRGRFWTGRDAQINQRFGSMFFPYLEALAISDTARVPVRYKDLGRLQGRMIARLNPRLAAYPSDYGFALDGPRPTAYRVKTWAGTQRPPWLRRLSFRLKHRSPEPRDGALAETCLGRVIDTDFPLMRGLFNLERVHSAQQFGLIATLEYLCQRYDLEVPAEQATS